MSIIEKRDFIHSHLHHASESLIDRFYEILKNEETLKEKLENRAIKSEKDINEGKVFSREEIEKRTSLL